MSFELVSFISNSGGSPTAVNARYLSTSSSITSTDAAITFATLDYDSHSAYSSGTYTVPVAGVYRINTACRVNAIYVANNLSQISIYVNGVQVSLVQRIAAANMTALSVLLTDQINLNQNDAVQIRGASSASSPSYSASSVVNYFSIFKLP